MNTLGMNVTVATHPLWVWVLVAGFLIIDGIVAVIVIRHVLAKAQAAKEAAEKSTSEPIS
jgi:hypothetical protein